MLNRRSMLQTAAATAAALTVTRSKLAMALPAEDPFLKELGLQLWTVRNQMSADAAGTIKAIKAAGYAQVELGDVMLADTLVPLAKENGLGVTSSFMTWNTLGEKDPKDAPTMAAIVDKATQFGLKHIVFGYIGKGSRETADQYKAIAERANKAAELCQTANIQLCYHNHSFEFEKLDNGQSGFEIFMERFDKPMKFELDIFWAAIGGWDVLETMQKLDGRISQLHLKDLKDGTGTIYDEGKVPADAFQEVGDGIIDMAKVIEVGHKIGVAQCHVEQDQSPNPIESIQMSYDYLKKLKT